MTREKVIERLNEKVGWHYKVEPVHGTNYIRIHFSNPESRILDMSYNKEIAKIFLEELKIPKENIGCKTESNVGEYGSYIIYAYDKSGQAYWEIA